jgi:hypothetical protein
MVAIPDAAGWIIFVRGWRTSGRRSDGGAGEECGDAGDQRLEERKMKEANEAQEVKEVKEKRKRRLILGVTRTVSLY